MNDNSDTQHKPDQLAAFAGTVIEQLPAVSRGGPIAERVFGAQHVAEKRDEYAVLAKLRSLAAAYGDGWLYSYPVSDQGVKKTITGPSIKLANDLARVFGNCDVDCRAVDMGSSWMLQARFVDLETGFSMSRPFEQPKSGAKLKSKDPERLMAISLQIGVSKAIRNVVTNALQSLTDFCLDEAKASVVEKIAGKLAHYREKVGERLTDMGIDRRKVEISVGRPLERWTDTDLARVISELQAVQEGMVTTEEVFGVAPAEAQLEQAAPAPAREPRKRKAREAKPKAQKAAQPAPAPARKGKAKGAPPKAKAAPIKPALARRSVLQVRQAMFDARNLEALRAVWLHEVVPFTWDEPERERLQATFDERAAIMEARAK